MTYEFKHLLPKDFSPTAKVWIYQASRPFLLSEALELETSLQHFVNQWTSHGAPVRGYANLLFGQFIILMADDSVSGCSTDSSIHVIKDAERRFGVSLFDRQTLAFIDKDKVQLVPLSQMEYAIKQGFIDGDTIYFNNIVSSKAEMERGWLIPVKDSWLAKRYIYA
jgi:hypothetical protein